MAAKHPNQLRQSFQSLTRRAHQRAERRNERRQLSTRVHEAKLHWLLIRRDLQRTHQRAQAGSAKAAAATPRLQRELTAAASAEVQQISDELATHHTDLLLARARTAAAELVYKAAKLELRRFDRSPKESLDRPVSEGDVLRAALREYGLSAFEDSEGGFTWLVVALGEQPTEEAPYKAYGEKHVRIASGEHANRPVADHDQQWGASIYDRHGEYVDSLPGSDSSWPVSDDSAFCAALIDQLVQRS
ncbi:hypothetical protein [Streptomyces sp. NPDC051572]|uniref:hypothetical protein n=1 Tax=Streptomyces sp. NPDC051572 TaxID=3155802 RepID=UPI00344FD36C